MNKDSAINDIDFGLVLFEKEKYKFFFENLDKPCIIIKDSKIIDVNLKVCQVLGFQNETECKKIILILSFPKIIKEIPIK